MALTSMKMSTEEAKEYTSPDAGEIPKYPYGLVIDLCDDQIKKLGISDETNVGDKVDIRARAVVSSKRTYETLLGGSDDSLCLQITDMEVKPASALYEK